MYNKQKVVICFTSAGLASISLTRIFPWFTGRRPLLTARDGGKMPLLGREITADPVKFPLCPSLAHNQCRRRRRDCYRGGQVLESAAA